MYLENLGMENDPFGKGTPVGDLYRTDQFEEMLSRLRNAADRRLFTVLTAPAGCGKSTLVRAFEASLEPEKYKFLYISDSRLTPRWLYNKMLEQLGCPKGFLYRGDGKKALHERFASIRGIEGKDIVCVVDEAHLLTRETLEETRFLLNCKVDSETPVCLVLVGQSELKQRLQEPRCDAIRQRVGMVCALDPLNRNQSEDFVMDRIRGSGAPDGISFTREAMDKMYVASRGVMRLLGLYATQALVYMDKTNSRSVDGPTMAELLERETL